jgi:hypothetical protein
VLIRVLSRPGCGRRRRRHERDPDDRAVRREPVQERPDDLVHPVQAPLLVNGDTLPDLRAEGDGRRRSDRHYPDHVDIGVVVGIIFGVREQALLRWVDGARFDAVGLPIEVGQSAAEQGAARLALPVSVRPTGWRLCIARRQQHRLSPAGAPRAGGSALSPGWRCSWRRWRCR